MQYFCNHSQVLWERVDDPESPSNDDRSGKVFFTLESVCYPDWDYDSKVDTDAQSFFAHMAAGLFILFALVLVLVISVIVMIIRCCMGLPPCCCCGNQKTVNVYHVVQ